MFFAVKMYLHTSQVLLFVNILDLWFLKRTLNSVVMELKYCKEHLVHVAK